MKIWKCAANQITMPEQDLKDTFVNDLFPIYKLLVISNHHMTLGEMLDVVLKKEVSVEKLYVICRCLKMNYYLLNNSF